MIEGNPEMVKGLWGGNRIGNFKSGIQRNIATNWSLNHG